MSATAVPSPGGEISSGGSVTISLKLSEPVTVIGGSAILNSNNGRTASYTGGSTTSSLEFTYSVGSETTADLQITGISGTIAGSASNEVSSSFMADLKLAINADSWKVGKGGVFNSGPNWSAGTAPVSSQEAVVSVAGAYIVSATSAATVAALDIGDKSATLSIRSGATFAATDGTGNGANLGNVTVASGATLRLGGAIDNSGTIAIDGTANLSGSISNARMLEAIGAGAVVLGGVVANLPAGVIDGDGALSPMTLSGVISNAGVVEGETARGLIIAGVVSNSKTIEALGTSASVVIDGSTVDNNGAGTIVASGSGAHVDLHNVSIAAACSKPSAAAR